MCSNYTHSRPTTSLTKSRLLVLDRDILAGGSLVLASNEVGDLLILGLLNSGLIVLWALTQELLLDVVDSCYNISPVQFSCPTTPSSKGFTQE